MCPAAHYSFSNPWLVNLSVRLFSVTVRTTCSGAPEGISASTSSVTLTFAPTRPDRCAITSSATRLASRPTRVGSRVTVPWNRLGCAATGTGAPRSEEHTSELQSRLHLVCRLLLEKKKKFVFQLLVRHK